MGHLPFRASDEQQKFMLSDGARLFIVTTHQVFQIQTPDDIDPKVTRTNVPWVVNLMWQEGTMSARMADTLGLLHEASGQLFYKKEDIHQITAELFDIMFLLWDAVSAKNQAEALMQEVERDAKERTFKPKEGGSAIVVPRAVGIEATMRAFFYFAKSCLVRIRRFAAKKLDFGSPGPKNFKQIATKLENSDSSYEEIRKFFERLNEPITQILLTREAIEHPGRDKRFAPQNFALTPDGIKRPSYRLEGTKFQNDSGPFDFLTTADHVIDIICSVISASILLRGIASADHPFPLGFKVMPEEERDPSFPLKYQILFLSEEEYRSTFSGV